MSSIGLPAPDGSIKASAFMTKALDPFDPLLQRPRPRPNQNPNMTCTHGHLAHFAASIDAVPVDGLHLVPDRPALDGVPVQSIDFLMARLVLSKDGSCARQATPDRLRHAILAWLEFHRLSGQVEADSDGCWLHAQIAQSVLYSLQNDIHHTLHADVFVAFMICHQGRHDAAQHLLQSRSDLQRCAISAALAMNTYPVACEQAPRADALQAFRSHVSSETLKFEMQPIWSLRDMAISGHEMLARLPGRSTIDWISHVVHSHDSTTLAKLALKHVRHWLNDTTASYASVNLTAGDFLNPTLLETIQSLDQSKRQRLVLELTEWQNPAESQRLPAVMQQLRNLGVRIAIDDFGVGYSSTVVLREVEFDIIKIDRSLVKSRRSNDIKLVQWALSCAEDMGASVVAEGIETDEDAQRVLDLGVPYGQGWHLDQYCPTRKAKIAQETGRPTFPA